MKVTDYQLPLQSNLKFMENPVIIFGATGLGKAAQEVFNSHQIVVYCFLDDDKSKHGTEINEVSVLGKTDDDGYLKYIGKKCEAFVAVDDNKLRKSIVNLLHKKRKVQPMNAVHSGASIAPSSEISYGNFVNDGVVIGANAKVGAHCILHSNAVVDFGARIADFVQIGAGAVVNAEVEVEEEVFIGSGAILIAGVKIGKGARIGAGSVVIADVKAGETVFGNPAKAFNT